MGASLRGALFLDRDGTIIHDTHYISNPDHVRLIDGAAQAIARANREGVPVVIVTNQSGIGRGILTFEQYDAVRARIDEMLASNNARINATFHCPHAPHDGADACNCRKPALGMYLDAARQLNLDLARSAYIGDRFRDVEPALTVGGLGILVPGENTETSDIDYATSTALVVDNIESAVNDALVWIAQHAHHSVETKA